MTLEPELTRAVAREKCIVGRAMHGKVPKRQSLFGKRKNRRRSETFPLGKVGAALCGRPETCASVTLDPMRGCTEWKNLLPSAASSAHGQLCSLRGFAAKIHFMAGASSFPQNALRWRFAGALGNPHFETNIRRGDPVWSPDSMSKRDA